MKTSVNDEMGKNMGVKMGIGKVKVGTFSCSFQLGQGDLYQMIT